MSYSTVALLIGGLPDTDLTDDKIPDSEQHARLRVVFQRNSDIIQYPDETTSAVHVYTSSTCLFAKKITIDKDRISQLLSV